MRMWNVVTLALVLVIIGAPLLSWLTTWWSAVALVLVPAAAAAAVMVVYFTWRVRFARRLLVEQESVDELRRAA